MRVGMSGVSRRAFRCQHGADGLDAGDEPRLALGGHAQRLGSRRIAGVGLDHEESPAAFVDTHRIQPDGRPQRLCHCICQFLAGF